MQTPNAQAASRAELVNKLITLRDALERKRVLTRHKKSNTEARRTLLLEPGTWGRWAFLAWTVLFAVLAFTGAAPVTDAFYQAALSPLVSKDWMEAHIPSAIAIMLVTPVIGAALLALTVTVLRNLLILPLQRNLVIRANVKRKIDNDMLANQMGTIRKELDKANTTIYGSAVWYPEAYLNEDALNFCATAVKDHRASDIPTAINLYEAELQHRALMAEQERLRGAIMIQGLMNDMNTRSVQNTIREEGARTRTSHDAAAARVNDQLRKPQTIHLRRR